MKSRFLLVMAAIAVVGCQAPVEDAGRPVDDVEARIERITSAVMPTFVIEGEPPVEPDLATRMAELRVPAVSIAFFEDGAITWARAWGMADVDAGTAATPDTLFQAASISKPVAAMAALAIVEDGALELDAPVNAALERWKVPDNDLTAVTPVTLRGLVTHTAGTTVHGFGGYPAGAEVPDTVGVLEGRGNSDAIVVDIPPRSNWRYSGGGYTVMQLLVEDVTGQPFARVAQERVLDPLRMASSAYAQPLPEHWASRTAVGYRADGSPVEGRWHTYPELAAAGLWTTPSDLARWAIAIQASAEDHPVLSASMIEQMLTPDDLGHGLGPALSDDGAFFGHGGANEGYRSTLQAQIDGGQGVAIMTNSDSGGRLTNELLLTVAREYGWNTFTPQRRVPIELTADQLAEYAGEYVADEPWRVSIELVDGALVGRRSWGPEEDNHLVPDGEDHFFVRADGSGVQFVREDGAIVAVDVQGFRFARRADE